MGDGQVGERWEGGATLDNQYGGGGRREEEEGDQAVFAEKVQVCDC